MTTKADMQKIVLMQPNIHIIFIHLSLFIDTKSALHKVGQIILEGHLQHCVRDGIEQGDAEETIAKFAKAVERFSNII